MEFARTKISSSELWSLSVEVSRSVKAQEGVVCGSLQEYLAACADDLLEWERNVTRQTPVPQRTENLRRDANFPPSGGEFLVVSATSHFLHRKLSAGHPTQLCIRMEGSGA